MFKELRPALVGIMALSLFGGMAGAITVHAADAPAATVVTPEHGYIANAKQVTEYRFRSGDEAWGESEQQDDLDYIWDDGAWPLCASGNDTLDGMVYSEQGCTDSASRADVPISY